MTSPTVSTAQNGNGNQASQTTWYDDSGRVIWTRDADGYLTHTLYDATTGAVLQQITDAAQPTPAAGVTRGSGLPTALNLTTTYTIDVQGRTTSVTNPGGNVSYWVYDDANRATLIYPGWHLIPSTSTYTTTGPVEYSREDRANGYTESATFAPPVTPSSTPSLALALGAIQSLSRSFTNLAGQQVSTRKYFSFAGLSGYTTNPNYGTAGVNYYETAYAYDVMGRLVRVVSSTGTITRTVYDSFGRTASTWIGTDDTPTSGEWSPTNTADTNLVKVSENQYDNSGNLSRTISFPNGNSDERATLYYYDWRDRLVATKSGVTYTDSGYSTAATEYTTDNTHPISFTIYDNLDEVIETRAYDGDAVNITTTNANGNMTVDPTTGNTTVYDAWNHMVKVSDGKNTLSTYAYDAVGRRIDEQAGVNPPVQHVYSAQWQVLEDRTYGVTHYQYVWSPFYVDDLILRDEYAANSWSQGALNLNYGDGGISRTDLGGGYNIPSATTRLLSDGSVDPSFNFSGFVGLNGLGVTDLAIDAYGSIIVAGFTYDDLGSELFCVGRISPDGVAGTYEVTPFPFHFPDDPAEYDYAEPRCMAIGPDGTILVAGFNLYDGENSRIGLGLACYNAYDGLSRRLWVEHDANYNVTSIRSAENFGFGQSFQEDPYGGNPTANNYNWVYLHQGGRYDPVAGVIHFRNRDLDPNTGAWRTFDPNPAGSYADGMNACEYLVDNPINYTDPNGLQTTQPTGDDWFVYRDYRKDNPLPASTSGSIIDRHLKNAGTNWSQANYYQVRTTYGWDLDTGAAGSFAQGVGANFSWNVQEYTEDATTWQWTVGLQVNTGNSDFFKWAGVAGTGSYSWGGQHNIGKGTSGTVQAPSNDNYVYKIEFYQEVANLTAVGIAYNSSSDNFKKHFIDVSVLGTEKRYLGQYTYIIYAKKCKDAGIKLP